MVTEWKVRVISSHPSIAIRQGLVNPLIHARLGCQWDLILILKDHRGEAGTGILLQKWGGEDALSFCY